MNNSAPLSRLRPENRLLLDCARTCVGSGVAQRIRGSVRDGLDWASLMETASEHGVLPLLCYNLNRLCATALPPDALQDLQARFRANSARSLSLTGELIKILQFLEASRIAALAFKGPALALSAYGNLALRQFGDLDVLVREKDFPTAKDLFLAAGYRPWKELTPEEERHHMETNHALTLVRPRDGLRLDLHWRITQERYAFELDLESMWERTIRVPFCGRNILAMSPEDSLLVLCIHGSKHGWERLGWVCDVAELLKANPELRWSEILSRGDALQIGRAVLLGLDLAKNLLDCPLPEHVSAAIRRDRGIRWVSALIRARLFERWSRPGPIERAVLFFMTRERLRDRFPHLAYTLHMAVTPNEVDTSVFSLPAFLYFLYYPLRAVRLTRLAVERLLSRTQ